MLTTALVLLLVGLVNGGFCAYVATEKGRDGMGWFILGFLFPLISLIAIAGTPPREETDEDVEEEYDEEIEEEEEPEPEEAQEENVKPAPTWMPILFVIAIIAMLFAMVVVWQSGLMGP